MTQLGKQLVVHAGERRWKRSKLERVLFCLFAVAAVGLVAGLLILLMQNRWETSKNTAEIAQQQETIERLLSISPQKDAQNDPEQIFGADEEDVYFDKYLPDYPLSPYVDPTQQQVSDDSLWLPSDWFPSDENEPATDVKKESKTDVLEDFSELYSNDSKIIEPVVRLCAMGMLSRAIEDSQISASTDYTQSFHGKYGRLDETCKDVYWLGNSYGCWLPLEKAMPQEDQWFQVDLKTPQPVGGIITQGRPKHYDQWVTSFQISCGITPDKLTKIEQVFSGNYDRNSKIMHIFPQTLLCRYIRFHPIFWQGQVALRMELIKGNCISVEKNPDAFWKLWDREDLPKDEDLSEIQNDEEKNPTEIKDPSINPDDEYRSTNDTKIEKYVQECAMGMKSRAIKDRRISVSHDYTSSFHGKFGRLDETCNDVYYLGNSYGCWLPYDKDIENQWFQVDLKRPQLVGGIVTQGRPKHYNQYVKTFQISCGKNSDQLHKIEENGEPKVFNGNFDSTSKVMNIFPQPMLCRYVRFHPVTVIATALRMELLRGNCGPDQVEIEVDQVPDLSKNLASEELLDGVTDVSSPAVLGDEDESTGPPFDDESFSGESEASGAEVPQPNPEKAKTGGFVQHFLAKLRRRVNGKGRNKKLDDQIFF